MENTNTFYDTWVYQDLPTLFYNFLWKNAFKLISIINIFLASKNDFLCFIIENNFKILLFKKYFNQYTHKSNSNYEL